MAQQGPDGDRSVKELASEEQVRGLRRTEKKKSRDNITSACLVVWRTSTKARWGGVAKEVGSGWAGMGRGALDRRGGASEVGRVLGSSSGFCWYYW